MLVGPNVSLYGFNLANWNLSGINAPGASFEHVDLTGANLSNANMVGAWLANATLTNANLSNTSLGMAVEGNYSRATLNWGGTSTRGSIQSPIDTTCPPGYVIGQMTAGKNNSIPGLEALGFNCVLVASQGYTAWWGGHHIDVLDNYSMGKWTSYCGSGQAMIGLTSHFDDNRVQNVGPICANFPTGSNAGAQQGTLTSDGLKNGSYGRYPDTSYTCPTGQWLVGVQAQNLSEGSVYFINQAICESWTQTTANGLVSGGIVGQPQLSPGWKLVNGYLVGPGVNLQNVDLSNQDLSNVNFGSANLSGTNLTNATLDYSTSSGITGSPQLSWPFWVANGYLLGPKVSLWGADLSNITAINGVLYQTTFVNTNLSGANFQGANFSNSYLGEYSTNLSNVNFYGANLSGANMSFHDYSSVNLSSGNLSGTDLTYTTLNGGSKRGVGNSWYFNNTNLTNATIVYATLTGNLSTVNFTGNTSLGDSFNQWLLFPRAWNYSNGTIHQ